MSVSQSEVVSDMGYYLFLKDQQDQTEKIEIFDGFICGRHKNSDLALRDARVSARHFCFHVKEGKIYIEDLGSANQTFVNDKRIKQQKKHLLANGDVIRVGGTLLGFSDNESADFSQIINISHKGDEDDEDFDEGTSMVLDRSSELDLDMSANHKTVGKEERRSQLFKDIKEKKQKIKGLQTQHKDVKEKIESVEKTQREYGELKQKRQQARDHFKDRPVQEKESLNSAYKKCEDEIKGLRDLIETKKREIQELEKLVQEKTKEVQQKEREKEEFSNDIEKAQEIELLTSKMSDLKETLDEVNNLKREKKLGQIQKEIDEEQKSLKDMQKEYSELF